MTPSRPLLLVLPLALCLVQPAGAKQRTFAQADLDADGFIDPVEFAGNAKGRAWKTAVLNFTKRDADGDGQLSPAEYGSPKTGGGGLYSLPGEREALPAKWTTGIELTWKDGLVSKAERKSFGALLKKATPAQRQQLQSYWDGLQAAALDGGSQGATEGIVGGWAQSDPGSAAGWINSLPVDRPLPEGYQGIINGWAQEDPGAAADWLAGIGDPAERPERPDRTERPPRGEP